MTTMSPSRKRSLVALLILVLITMGHIALVLIVILLAILKHALK